MSLIDDIEKDYGTNLTVKCPLISMLNTLSSACQDALLALSTERPRMAALYLGLASFPLEEAIKISENIEINIEAKLKRILLSVRNIEGKITNYDEAYHEAIIEEIINLAEEIGHSGKIIDLSYYFQNVDERKKVDILKRLLQRHKEAVSDR